MLESTQHLQVQCQDIDRQSRERFRLFRWLDRGQILNGVCVGGGGGQLGERLRERERERKERERERERERESNAESPTVHFMLIHLRVEDKVCLRNTVTGFDEDVQLEFFLLKSIGSNNK